MIQKALTQICGRILELESEIDKQVKQKDYSVRRVFQLNDILEINIKLRDSLLQPQIKHRYYQ